MLFEFIILPPFIFSPPSGPPTGGTVGDSTPPHPLDPMSNTGFRGLTATNSLCADGMRQNGEYMRGKLDSLGLIRGGAGEEIWSPAAPLERGADGG